MFVAYILKKADKFETMLCILARYLETHCNGWVKFEFTDNSSDEGRPVNNCTWYIF